uniref:hypothetical protein n=1 Tax=Bacteroides thetaiotaomicron TaxID=818 RepID=UPI001F1DE4D0
GQLFVAQELINKVIKLNYSVAELRLMELLVIIGLVVMTTPGNLQLSMSASALGASSRMQEEEKMASSK